MLNNKYKTVSEKINKSKVKLNKKCKFKKKIFAWINLKCICIS